jgi:non-ribosomal peptide synthetase component E (peptide arylation enzyme)
MEVTERDVFLVYLPLTLHWGYLTLLQAIITGARAVLRDQFSARVALDLIESERVTLPSAVSNALDSCGSAVSNHSVNQP